MTRPAPSLQDIGEDVPLRLDVAARLAFPDGSIGLSSLRNEAKKGRLRVWRIANKDMTTLRSIREMMDRCLVKDSLPASGSDPEQISGPRSGSSEMVSDKSLQVAQEAARRRVELLKQSFQNTSQGSTSRSPKKAGHVVPLKSR